MRRFSLVANATLLIYFSTSLLFAQHGGGGHSNGGHSGGASSHVSSGYSSVGRSTSAPGVISGARAPIGPTPIGLQTYYSGYTGINNGAIPLGNRRAGRGFVPFFGYPYYVSTFDDYSQPSYYDQPGPDPNAQTAQVTANLMGEQIERLSAEVEEMRAQQSYVASSQGTPTPYRLPSAGDPPQKDPPIILVLTNGNKVTMESFAVMNDNFWDFSKQPARKIPLSSVDLAASKQATEASGADFPVVR